MRLKLPTQSACTGCLACVDSCPFDALAVTEGKEGFTFPKCIEENCRNCHLCEKTCPVVSGDRFSSNASFVPYPMAAWTLDMATRLRSSSGGVFPELAKVFIAAGGSVAGAVIEGVRVKHVIVDSLDELSRLQGSKYLQSDTRGIYAEVKTHLDNLKPVLFSGTPCQVAGLKNFLGDNKRLGQLVTVEVVCHGVPSEKVMERFLESEKDITEIVRFRSKEYGWKDSFGLIVKRQGEEAHIPYKENYFTRIFLAENTLRRSCYACPFASDGSRADLSLADFWRLKRWPDEQGAGVSAVVVRSPGGRRALMACDQLNTTAVPWKEVADGNPRLCSGSHLRLMLWHPLRLLLGLNLRIMTSRDFLRLYSGTAKISPKTLGVKLANRIWAPLLKWRRQSLLRRFLANHKEQAENR